MVNGPRRNRSAYSLNQRHFGKTSLERNAQYTIVEIVTRIAARLHLVQMHNRQRVFQVIQGLIQQYRHIDRFIIIPIQVFLNRHRNLATWNDNDLYDMRITDRGHIAKLLTALQIPVRWECDNGTIEDREVGFLMFLFWISFPRKLSRMQTEFGREYSQISRILKAVWVFMDINWGHLVTNNIPYFVARLPEYNRRFLAKYQRVHGFPCSPRFSRTALFTDGTKVQINRGQQINYSGHKHIYCYSFLLTTAMDGMIVDAYGPRVGSDNDHGMQNNSQLGQQLSAAQVGQPLMYVSSTDKGLHAQVCIVPMYNNVPNTIAQQWENHCVSAMRCTNEWDVGRPKSLFKYLDYRKVHFDHLQPIGLFFRVCCIMTNAITILDHNQSSEYYHCLPPLSLASYFI